MSWMCMVLFSQDTPFDTAAFLRHFQAAWPNTLIRADASSADGGGDADTTHSFDVGDGSLVIGRMPVAIPDFAVNAERPPMFWPKAAEEATKHRVHWIVTVPGESGKAVGRARLLTQSVHSLLASQRGALGVTWGSHAHMVGSAIFQTMAAEIGKGVDPYLLWVDIQCGWAPPGPSSGLSTGFTHGLSDFELKDFETLNATEPPRELHGRLLGLIEYVIKRGPVIRNGQTIGQSAEERIRVVESASSFGQENRVLRLDYSGTTGKPSPAVATKPTSPGGQAGGAAAATAKADDPLGLAAGAGSNHGSSTPFAGQPANVSAVSHPQGTTSNNAIPYGANPYGASPHNTNPYGANPYGVSPYGPGAVGPPGPRMSVSAIIGFIFAVISPFLFCLCFVQVPSSIIAIVLGHLALVQINRGQGLLYGKGLAIASLIIGYPVLLGSLAFFAWIFVIAPATRPGTPPGFPSGMPFARNLFEEGQGANGNGSEIELDEPSGNPNAGVVPSVPSVPDVPTAPSVPNIPGQPSSEPSKSDTAGTPVMPGTPNTPGMPNMPGIPGMPNRPPFPNRPQFPRPNFNLPPGVPDPFGDLGSQGGNPAGRPDIPGFPNFPGMPGAPGFPSPSGGKSTPKTSPESKPSGSDGGTTDGPPTFNPFAPLPIDPDTVVASFPGISWPVRSLSFSADGSRLAAGRIDAGFTVFDIDSGKPVFQRDRLASLGSIVALAWSPDGKYLFTGGQTGQLVSWEVAQANAKPRNHAGHPRTVGCLVVGPEARFIISAGHDRSVTWQQPDAPEKARSVKLSGSGDILAIRLGTPPITAMATDGKQIFEINLKTSEITKTIELDRRPCQSADFSSDGNWVAVSEGREVKVYEAATGKSKVTIQVGSDIQWCVRFTPDSQQLITGGRGQFYAFEPASGKRIAGISVGQPLYVQTMAIDSESRRAAVIPDSAGQTLRVFRLPTTAPKSSP